MGDIIEVDNGCRQFVTKLYKHQQENLNFHMQFAESADWSEPGTGKSAVILKKIVNLMNSGHVVETLIVCPLSVMSTWAIEIRKHTDLTYCKLTGSLGDKIDKLWDEDADIFLLSYDSIPGRKDTQGKLLKHLDDKMFDMLVCDEVTMIRNFGTMRTRAVTILSRNTDFKHFMSGTPLGNDLTSVWNLYYALDEGETFGKNFFAFRNKYFINKGWKFPDWKIKENMAEDFSNRIYRRATRTLIDDCGDIPPKVFSTRFCELSDEQFKYYKPIAVNLVKQIETEEGNINVNSALVKLSKLSQITSGFIYTDKEPHFFKKNPKLELFKETIASLGSKKFIIFCRWKMEIKIISEFLAEEDIQHVCLHGGVAEKDREKMVLDFQNNPDVKGFVSNIAAGKFSLTLTASATIIYFSLTFSVDDWIQSQGRIRRISQKSNTCLYLPLLVNDSIDTYIYNSLDTNTELVDSVMDASTIRANLMNTLERGRL